MRIAHVIHRYPPALGGAEAYFARLSRYLAGRGEEVLVLTTDAYDLEAFWSPQARRLPVGQTWQDGVCVRRFPIRHQPLQRYWRKLLSLVPSPRWQAFHLPCNPHAPDLWGACNQETGFDVVHASALPYAYPILCAERLARRCGAPFVLTPFLHLGDPTAPRDRTRRAYLAPAMRYLLCRADALFVQTLLEKEALIAVGIPDQRIVLQGLGVEPAECTGGNRLEARHRWGIPADAVVVGHLANKSVEKGTVDLLYAMNRVWQTHPETRLLLAGPEMPNFRRAWRAFADERRICNLGPLSEPEKRDFYTASDIFALPSRSDSFGLVLLEAWANAVPSVAYRAGGLAEVVRHGHDGLLVPCGAVADLAEAIAELIRNP
jgi:glycosyltransferase involved in cell wall biosynthesis